MSETLIISQKQLNSIDRTLTRVLNRLNASRIHETITEKEAAEFLEVTVDRLGNMRRDGIVSRNAFIITVNNNRRYFKEKLVKH